MSYLQRLLFFLYCFAVGYHITNLLCLDFEYLGGPNFKQDGPTFKQGGPIFGREGSQKYAHPLFEQPLKFIAHRHIFESLRYVILQYCYILIYCDSSRMCMALSLTRQTPCHSFQSCWLHGYGSNQHCQHALMYTIHTHAPHANTHTHTHITHLLQL